MRRTNNNTVISLHNPGSPVSEAYRNLRMNIQLSSSLLQTDVQIVVVTSAQRGDGKSVTAANLAATYAQANKKVLLIDADFRSPAQHTLFKLTNASGLCNLLLGEAKLEDAVRQTELKSLFLMSSGAQSGQAYGLLDLTGVDRLFEELRGRYDVVIIDSPPLLDATESKLLASRGDGVLLVIRSGESKGEDVRKAKGILEQVGARILGAVVNDKKE